MRINNRLAVQMLDDGRIVFIDTETEAEHVINTNEIPDLARHIANTTVPGQGISLGHDVLINQSEFSQVCFALGYFWGLSR